MIVYFKGQKQYWQIRLIESILTINGLFGLCQIVLMKIYMSTSTLLDVLFLVINQGNAYKKIMQISKTITVTF